MGRVKGVKLTDNPKNKTIKFRIDDDTDNKLTSICERTRLNKSEVIRKGILQQYDELEQQK